MFNLYIDAYHLRRTIIKLFKTIVHRRVLELSKNVGRTNSYNFDVFERKKIKNYYYNFNDHFETWAGRSLGLICSSLRLWPWMLDFNQIKRGLQYTVEQLQLQYSL